MRYVGMDISSNSFMVHALDEKRREVFRGEVTSTKSGLERMLREVGGDRKLVCFEAGNQLKWVADFLKRQQRVDVHVVHPNEVKWIVESKGKTDKIDAKKLAELARADMLPRAVHLVDGTARELRELSSARFLLQSKRVGLINSVRGFVKQEGVKLPTGFFGSRDWKQTLEKTRLSKTLKAIIAAYVQAIEGLTAAEEELTEKILAVKDARVELLKTMPAIGELSSRVLVGALDDVSRFDDKKAVANYGALTPTIYQSGSVTRLGRINRDGRQEVRRVLLQCAHTIARMKPSPAVRPLKEFYERIAKRRGKKIALVALSRKLLTTAYGVMKSGEPYDPRKLAA